MSAYRVETEYGGGVKSTIMDNAHAGLYENTSGRSFIFTRFRRGSALFQLTVSPCSIGVDDGDVKVNAYVRLLIGSILLRHRINSYSPRWERTASVITTTILGTSKDYSIKTISSCYTSCFDA